MPEKDFIATKDVNEVAKIHSNPQYANWRYEYVDGEYRFYSPTYKKQETLSFYHGGVAESFSTNDLEPLRPAMKQGSKYAGFYMFDEDGKNKAFHYAEQTNSTNHENDRGVVKIDLDPNVRIQTLERVGQIDRLRPEELQNYIAQGYDLLKGKSFDGMQYVLLNKDKIVNMQFQPLEQKQELQQSEVVQQEEQNVYMTLEELAPLLSESGYMCFGHGTGRKGNSDEVVDSIFSEGLRTKNNSLYYTTIGLTTPTPENKELLKEIGMPEPTIEGLKTQFNNWQHQDSKKIIIARVPTEYINKLGERSDLDGEMYGAFYIQELQPNGQATNYLDPKFIVGCFDVEKQAVRMNKRFERTLSEQSIQQIKSAYKKTVEKTKARLESQQQMFSNVAPISQDMPQQIDQSIAQEWDMSSFDDENIIWDEPEQTMSAGRSR